ncbi:hypothetical protein ACJX0J_041900 [Zea mays]
MSNSGVLSNKINAHSLDVILSQNLEGDASILPPRDQGDKYQLLSSMGFYLLFIDPLEYLLKEICHTLQSRNIQELAQQLAHFRVALTARNTSLMIGYWKPFYKSIINNGLGKTSAKISESRWNSWVLVPVSFQAHGHSCIETILLGTIHIILSTLVVLQQRQILILGQLFFAMKGRIGNRQRKNVNLNCHNDYIEEFMIRKAIKQIPQRVEVRIHKFADSERWDCFDDFFVYNRKGTCDVH